MQLLQGLNLRYLQNVLLRGVHSMTAVISHSWSPPPPYQIAVEETEGSGGFDADSNIPLCPWRQDIALFIHNLIERSFHGLRASFTQPGYPPTCTPKHVDNSVHSGQRLPTCTS